MELWLACQRPERAECCGSPPPTLVGRRLDLVVANLDEGLDPGRRVPCVLGLEFGREPGRVTAAPYGEVANNDDAGG